MTVINPASKLTYEHYLELPEGLRHEILDGGLWQMTPAPSARHQRVLSNLHLTLSAHVASRELGKIWIAPFDVILSDHNVVQPDLLFIASANSHIVEDRGVFGAPDLVIEILSPSTTKKDKEIKRTLYERHGVREYWLVSPEAETVQVLTLSDGRYEQLGTYAGTTQVRSEVWPKLELRAEAVFLS